MAQRMSSQEFQEMDKYMLFKDNCKLAEENRNLQIANNQLEEENERLTQLLHNYEQLSEQVKNYSNVICLNDMELNITTIKIACKHLNESQDILERLHSNAIASKEIERASIIMRQMQKIGSLILDYEYRIKSAKKE